ncbi:hypothetical protein E2C01_062039 [Portunus trituberculatus]|uniref:Uncharacterized protein n=1 Tax=Portunus trituberculatus TaxID=210409 RepID=A0A5B7HCJ4_PORTR|nr:hypothetical protein [Portunus trituberculatus]
MAHQTFPQSPPVTHSIHPRPPLLPIPPTPRSRIETQANTQKIRGIIISLDGGSCWSMVGWAADKRVFSSPVFACLPPSVCEVNGGGGGDGGGGG